MKKKRRGPKKNYWWKSQKRLGHGYFGSIKKKIDKIEK